MFSLLLLPVAMETGPGQVEPLAGVCAVTWGMRSVREERAAAADEEEEKSAASLLLDGVSTRALTGEWTGVRRVALPRTALRPMRVVWR
ncbi:hypothetical protein F2P81_013760 [Scophthalmus maximus]|uniref:Uncharacterized protein n=1 Tax=Scophthalmus maximus TaxID=52904 RepID=A0A6A4SRN0_SCOMX|nr:hypothetical protein F2P81_013760 [Scophthalmus maximus]